MIWCVRGRFKNTCKLLNLRALQFEHLNKMHIFQCMGKIFCEEFIREPLKFHTKCLAHTFVYKAEILRDLWFKSAQAFLKCPGLLCDVTVMMLYISLLEWVSIFTYTKISKNHHNPCKPHTPSCISPSLRRRYLEADKHWQPMKIEVNRT